MNTLKLHCGNCDRIFYIKTSSEIARLSKEVECKPSIYRCTCGQEVNIDTGNENSNKSKR